MINFIVKTKGDLNKVLFLQYQREQILGACRMEDSQQTTSQEKNEMFNLLEYHFRDIPFICNGRFNNTRDAAYAAFFIITTSDLVRRWVEREQQSFEITLELDLDSCTYTIACCLM